MPPVHPARGATRRALVRLEDMPDVLKVPDVAQVLRINRNAVYEAVHRGEIPAFRLGRQLRVPKAGLHQLLGEKPVAPPVDTKPMPLVPNGDCLVHITYKGRPKD